MRSSGTFVTVVGYIGIVCWSVIETLGVTGDVPATFFDSMLTWRP